MSAEKNSEGCELTCDLSFFENPITSTTEGSIKNISEYSLSVGNLMRAVFLQIADNFLRLAETITDNQKPVDRIIFSGGVARKIKSIRNRILEKYSCAYEVNTDETLRGLFRYGKEFQR